MNNEDLIKRIEALEKWQADRKRQQITFPLDNVSLEVLNKYFVRIIDHNVFILNTGTGSDFRLDVFEAIQGDQTVSFGPGSIRYTVDVSADTINIVEKLERNKFANDQHTILYSTGDAPGGLVANTFIGYYVINASNDGYTFQLSSTQEGSAIDITDIGVGKQFIEPF